VTLHTLCQSNNIFEKTRNIKLIARRLNSWCKLFRQIDDSAHRFDFIEYAKNRITNHALVLTLPCNDKEISGIENVVLQE
jgi:hypothetical protein